MALPSSYGQGDIQGLDNSKARVGMIRFERMRRLEVCRRTKRQIFSSCASFLEMTFHSCQHVFLSHSVDDLKPGDSRNQVIPILLLLQATEGHLRPGDIFLRVLKVLEECVLLPLDTLGLVGVGV